MGARHKSQKRSDWRRGRACASRWCIVLRRAHVGRTYRRRTRLQRPITQSHPVCYAERLQRTLFGATLCAAGAARTWRGDVMSKPFSYVANVPPRERGETFAESAATTNSLLRKQWNAGGGVRYDQDLLDLGFTKNEAHINDGTLSRGDFNVERPSSPIFADDMSISDPRVLDLLPQLELETSDPVFDGALSSWYADDRSPWEDDPKPLPLLRRGRGRSSNLARNAARKAGKRTYTCEPPCICGCDQRYTSRGVCVECSKWRGSMYRAEHKQELAVKAHERYLRTKQPRDAARARSKLGKDNGGRIKARTAASVPAAIASRPSASRTARRAVTPSKRGASWLITCRITLRISATPR